MAFRYRKFNVYQDAKNLHKEIVVIVNRFPRQYQYLADQVKRSSLSIVLNIAEGSSKQSDKDFNRYVTISLGSADEVVATSEVALDLKLITAQQFQVLEQKLESILKQLGGLSKTLRS